MKSECSLIGKGSQELETNRVSNLDRFQRDDHGDLFTQNYSTLCNSLLSLDRTLHNGNSKMWILEIM